MRKFTLLVLRTKAVALWKALETPDSPMLLRSDAPCALEHDFAARDLVC